MRRRTAAVEAPIPEWAKQPVFSAAELAAARDRETAVAAPTAAAGAAAGGNPGHGGGGTITNWLQRLRLSPRQHNCISYVGALVVFWGAAVLLAGGGDGLCAGLRGDIRHALASVCWSAHFARRTFESGVVHVYSKDTVSLMDTATEFVYYWGFALWIVQATVCSAPNQQRDVVIVAAPEARGDGAAEAAAPPLLPAVALAGLLLWGLAEAGNCACHVALSRLRGSSGGEAPDPAAAAAAAQRSRRVLPSGPLFALVSHPHYLCEILSWVGFALLLGGESIAPAAFLGMGE
eukprot:COSAG01_NODE_2980_length_6758_cov_25.187416_4_plen_291_part_00